MCSHDYYRTVVRICQYIFEDFLKNRFVADTNYFSDAYLVDEVSVGYKAEI